METRYDEPKMSNSIVCGRWDDQGECYVIVGALDGIRLGETQCGEMSRYPLLRPADCDDMPLILDSEASAQLAWHYALTATIDDESGRSDLVSRFFSFVAYEEDGDEG